MVKLIFGVAILLLIHGCCFAQIMPGDRVPIPGEEKELLTALKQSQPGIKQIELLLDLSACYLYLPGEEKNDMDKAISFAYQAKQLSNNLKFTDGYNEAMVHSAEILLESGDTKNAKAILDSALLYVQNTLNQVRSLKNFEREARAMRQKATIYFRQGHYSLAETEFLNLIKLCQAKKFHNLHYIYHRLAIMQTFYKHDYNKALYYSLEAVKSMESTGDFKFAGPVYRSLGYTYRLIGMFQKAVDYYHKSMQYYNKNSSSIQLELAEYATNALLKMRRGNEALLLLEKTINEFPPQNNHDKKAIHDALGYCYRSLKQYDSAEVYYRRLFDLRLNDGTIGVHDYKTMGQLYVESGKYSMAKPYLDKALNEAPKDLPTNWYAHLHFLLYKADSASGNYLSAMDHLMKNKALDDIEYEQSKIRENQELQIKYETDKKDQDIKLKEQSILLLNRQTELQKKDLEQAGLQLQFETSSKEQSLQLARSEAEKKDKDLQVNQQNIELLKKEGLLQQSNLKQAKTSRNMFIGGAIMLFFLLTLVYGRYRQKQLTARRLEAQQTDINDKNAELVKLITEKEWLLKEVHHRVKNNLHTVMSLLQSQSAYLENDALAAIHDSQHRIFSMSLIHQKLYQSEDITTIDMSVYLPELVNYLSESFNIKQQIRFNLDIEPIELDVSQAIPLGLIFNEAITNALKYAFTFKANNKIAISMKTLPNSTILLTIADNGVGLPTYSDIDATKSLGINLMKGLSKDIGGDFKIQNDNGCKIIIHFVVDTPFQNISKLTLPKIDTPVLKENRIKENLA